jgi:hypothetical protein
MVNACVQSPTEPGVTMACSSCWVASAEPNMARLPAWLVRDLSSSWDSPVSLRGLANRLVGGMATALVSRCDAAGGSYGGHSWPSTHAQAGIGLAAPGRPVRSLVAKDRRRARPDRTGPPCPRARLGPCWVRTASGTAGSGWARAVTTGKNKPQLARLRGQEHG